MRTAKDMFVVATLLLAPHVVIQSEAGRPRSTANSNGPSGDGLLAVASPASFAALSEEELQHELPEQASSEMSGLRSALLQYANQIALDADNLGNRSDKDVAAHSNSLVQSQNADDPFPQLQSQNADDPFPQLQESSGLQEMTRAAVAAAPPASFEGYAHYPDSGEYKSKDEDTRSTANSKIVADAPKGKLKEPEATDKADKDLKSCAADPKTPTTVKELTDCLKEAYDYFSVTVVNKRKDSVKQNEVDSQALNLMFDQMFDLANMKRSLDAFQADEKKVSTTLLEQTKELRTKINTLIIRGKVEDAGKK